MTTEMGIFEVMHNCRAMRRLKPEPVPRETILKLLDSANRGPTGSNMQGVRWVVVQDADQKERLATLNRDAVHAYIGPDSGRAGELPHQSAGKRQRMLDAVLWQADHLHEIPVLVIACYQFSEPVDELGRGRAGGSLWPAVQNLLLAARALGLGAAPTTLALTRRDEARAALELPDDVEPFCLVPIGYPTGNFGPVTRLPVEETVHWDRWGGVSRPGP